MLFQGKGVWEHRSHGLTSPFSLTLLPSLFSPLLFFFPLSLLSEVLKKKKQRKTQQPKKLHIPSRKQIASSLQAFAFPSFHPSLTAYLKLLLGLGE